MPKSNPPPAANLLLDKQLCFALYAASLVMTKTYRPLLAPLSLTRKLVAQGLLARRRSDDDDRVVLISVTPAGQALKRRAHAVHAQVGCSTQRSASERKALTGALQALRSALSA